jgi:hypothetical protein
MKQEIQSLIGTKIKENADLKAKAEIKLKKSRKLF